MAIPKIKLYRLDRNYSPLNTTDIATEASDEILPFVEKGADLTRFETLEGVTARDLCVGKACAAATTPEIALDAETGESAPFDCDGWLLGEDRISVEGRAAGGVDFSPIPKAYWRLDFGSEDRVGSDGVRHRIRTARLFVTAERARLQEIKGTDGSSMPFQTENVAFVKLTYRTFRDDIAGEAIDGDLCLERGRIYDGTATGRWETAGELDRDGFVPKKAEGNPGYALKTYPLRQQVFLREGASSAEWVADGRISASGQILPANTQSWIVAATDERRPRLFEEVRENGHRRWRELEQGTQYSYSLNLSGTSRSVLFSLSSEYYGGVFPEAVFVRYSAYGELLPNDFAPDYRGFDGTRYTGDTGALSTTLTSLDSLSVRVFRTAAKAGAGYDATRDLLFANGNVALPPGAESPCVYVGGILVWKDGASISAGYAVTKSGDVLAVSPEAGSPEPESILISYGMREPVGNSASGGRNPCMGWRICAWEKTRSAKTFVSSFPNWVGDHLDNSPDVFWGWREYEGVNTTAADGNVLPNYCEDPHSVLYREGAVEFPEAREQRDEDYVRNWPGGGTILASATALSLRRYMQCCHAKFAHLDSVFNATDALLREVGVSNGSYRYRLLEDPAHASLEDKRWVGTSDARLPQSFSANGRAIPFPVSVEGLAGDCSYWTPIDLPGGKCLAVATEGRRLVAVRDAVDPPVPASDDYEGKTWTSRSSVAWDTSEGARTALLDSVPAGLPAAEVTKSFRYRGGRWQSETTRVSLGGKTIPFSAEADLAGGGSIAERIETTLAEERTLVLDSGAECAYRLRLVPADGVLILKPESK